MTNEEIKNYIAQEHATAVSYAQLWSDLSKGVVDCETVKLARGYVDQHVQKFGIKLTAFSEQVQDAMVEFQINAWSGAEPSAATMDLVRDSLPL